MEGTTSSVRLRPGATLDRFRAALDTVPGGSSMFFQPGAIISTSIHHAVEAQTAGLWIVTGVVALAVVAALGQILAGFVRLTPASRESLRAIGYTAIQGSAEEVTYAATLVVTGTAVGVVVAVLASPLFPGGFARALEPDRGHIRVDPPALLVGATVVGLALLLWVAVAARLARRRRPAPRPSAVADAVSRTGLPPEAPSACASRSRVTAGTGCRRGRRSPCSAWRWRSWSARSCSDRASPASSKTAPCTDTTTAMWPARPLADRSIPPFIDAAGTAPGYRRCDGTVPGLSAPIGGDDVDLVGVEPLRGGLLPVVLAGRFPASPDEVRGRRADGPFPPHPCRRRRRLRRRRRRTGHLPRRRLRCPALRVVRRGRGPGRRHDSDGPAAGGAGSRVRTARPPAPVRYRTGRRRAGIDVAPSTGQSTPPPDA